MPLARRLTATSPRARTCICGGPGRREPSLAWTHGASILTEMSESIIYGSAMIAFVTGAGRGIGANIARKLAGEGWDVVVAARTPAQVEAVADEIGGRAVVLDVTDREAVERAVADAGPVDLLVANAGI